MKKMVVLAAVVLAAAVACQAGISVTWGFEGYGGDLNSGAPPESQVFQAGWLVQLYQDVGKDNSSLSGITGFTGGTGAGSVLGGGGFGNDVAILSQTDVLTTFFGSTYWGSSRTWDSLKNFNVYSVVYNAASIGAASSAIVIDSNPFVIPNLDDQNLNYSQTSIGANNDFVSVPEPASLALMGLGALIVGIRRVTRR